MFGNSKHFIASSASWRSASCSSSLASSTTSIRRKSRNGCESVRSDARRDLNRACAARRFLLQCKARLKKMGVSQNPTLRCAPAALLRVLLLFSNIEMRAQNGPPFSDANWSTMNPSISGANGPVDAAVVDGAGNLYIGGDFTAVGDVIANVIAKWNGSNWTTLGSGMNGPLSALAASGSNVYAGGLFTMAGGSSARYITKWNGSSWIALSLGMMVSTPFGGTSVNALAVSGTDLYAGGYFTSAGTNAANSIAKWDGSSWRPLRSGMNGTVYALAVSGSNVYAGGGLTTTGDSRANVSAKW